MNPLQALTHVTGDEKVTTARDDKQVFEQERPERGPRPQGAPTASASPHVTRLWYFD